MVQLIWFISFSGDRRDGCLRFSMNRIAKDNKNVTSIIPVKVNLYVYIRKKRDRSKNSQRRIKKSDRTKSGAKDRKYGNRNRRKQKGRKIKLFVSNGHKRLSTMRMRVRKSMWRCIDLPISQFPEVIYIKDTFKICLKCKRCNKNVKVDLYRKQKTHKSNKKPTIPFIHIETANNLSPHHIYRHKRSHKNKLHCKQSCCKLESFKVDITKTFPTILAPKELFFKYCLNTCAADVRLHNSTVDYIAKRNMRVVEEDRENHHRQCLPQTYTSFSFLYLLPNSDVKVGTIPNMFPASCQCLRSHQSNYIETWTESHITAKGNEIPVFEPQRQATCFGTCAPRVISDQPVLSHSLIRLITGRIWDSQRCKLSTWERRRL